MESTETPRSALDEIKTVAFKQGIRGYVVDEVDEFLDRAGAEVDQIREQMHQMRQQLRQAGERIRQLEGGAPAPAVVAPAPSPVPAPVQFAPSTTSGAEQVTAMIAMAQQFIDQAQQEAEARAREMTTAAQERARDIVTEARSRAEDEVTRLNGLKQRLSEDVTLLTRQLDAERTRVSAVLSELSQWIENSLHVGANAQVPSAQVPSTPPAVATSTTTHSSAPAATSFVDAEPVATHVVTAPTPVPASPDVPPRPMAPPPAPPANMGQVLNFEPSADDRP